MSVRSEECTSQTRPAYFCTFFLPTSAACLLIKPDETPRFGLLSYTRGRDGAFFKPAAPNSKSLNKLRTNNREVKGSVSRSSVVDALSPPSRRTVHSSAHSSIDCPEKKTSNFLEPVLLFSSFSIFFNSFSSRIFSVAAMFPFVNARNTRTSSVYSPLRASMRDLLLLSNIDCLSYGFSK